MNAFAQLNGAQVAYDARLTHYSTRDDAAQDWLYDGAQRLLSGHDVVIVRAGKPEIRICFEALAFAIDAHIWQRLRTGQVDEGTLGALALIADQRSERDSETLALLLGSTKHPEGVRFEIAQRLLEPHIAAALEALAEENEQ